MAAQRIRLRQASCELQDTYALQTRNGVPLHVPRAVSKIVPLTTIKQVVDRRTGETSIEEVTLRQDEGMHQATLQALQSFRPVVDGAYIMPGSASQFSDGPSACVLMNAKLVERRNIEPLELFAASSLRDASP